MTVNSEENEKKLKKVRKRQSDLRRTAGKRKMKLRIYEKKWKKEQTARLTERRDLISKLEIKQKIVEEAKVVNNNAQVARNYGISETTLQHWRMNEDKICK